MTCDKRDIGFLPFPEVIGHQTFLSESNISEDNQKLDLEDIDTGKLSPISPRRLPCRGVNPNLPSPRTPSPVGPLLLKNTSGKKNPEMENHSNSASPQSNVTRPTTGMLSLPRRRNASIRPSRRTYLFAITAPSCVLELILRNPLLWNEKSSFTMDQQGPENPTELGPKLDLVLTAKIRVVSSGMATRIRKMLSSMNLEEASISRIYYDGLTDIHALWSLKDHRESLVSRKYGLRPTYTPTTGIPNSMMPPEQLSEED